MYEVDLGSTLVVMLGLLHVFRLAALEGAYITYLRLHCLSKHSNESIGSSFGETYCVRLFWAHYKENGSVSP